jgi:hypothetical protein
MAFDFLNRMKTHLNNLFGTIMAPGEAIGEKLYDVTHSNPKPLSVSKPQVQPQVQAQEPQPTATPSPSPTATPMPTPYPTAAPGIDNAKNYITSQIPTSYQGTPEEYYPALGNSEFMQGITDADKIRQGLASLLLLQSFFESGLGRGSKNYFGALPGGEGSGVNPQFTSPTDALDYQLGPNVLGGGANPNMNITGSNSPLTEPDIRNLYKSYNPSGDYVNNLIKVLFQQQSQ